MNTQRQKTGGRQKGTPNKITASTREFLQHLIDDNQGLITENFRKLEPYQMMTVLAKILPYISPKLATKTEKDEHEIALQQMNSYLQLAKIVNKWEEQEEEEQEDEYLPSYQQSLKTSTLDKGNNDDETNESNTTLTNLSSKSSTLNPEPSLNPSTLENTYTQTGISKEEMAKIIRLQIYHKYAHMLDEKTQAELALYLMKDYGVTPQELMINGKLPKLISTLDKSAQSFSKGSGSGDPQSAGETEHLKPSTLDNENTSSSPLEQAGETSYPTQSKQEKIAEKPAGIQKPKQKKPNQPFYASIVQKKRKR